MNIYDLAHIDIMIITFTSTFTHAHIHYYLWLVPTSFLYQPTNPSIELLKLHVSANFAESFTLFFALLCFAFEACQKYILFLAPKCSKQ